ncbi:response regulator [Croceicoccus naphthovorans]|uniref:LuxR family transcriptional regulator n=1 Tax=Croceicoccus naphthovorans TaxID=1348774 RepID=A0A0G3XFR7_9SPHN|nr:response regulator transcription factor [Croceicoccus naphthovorans]AKM09208.1 LuxR family transcriptional regulator [Croceicoccus naphthovorans]MBB3990409.1 DNA-binding NarL/FixJ family response regulator [Croceicoccus naphthovorans]
MSGRVVIADDHPLLRAAIRGCVEQAWPGREVVEVADAASARAEAAKGGVELLTLDLHMADSNGLQTLMAFRQDFPDMPVAIVSASEESRIRRGAQELGAAAFIPKSAPLPEMRAALTAVAEGDVWFPNGVEDEAEDEGNIEKLARLTPAQRRILTLVSEGKLNKQIAHEMDISEATVKAHMTAIFRRLGVVNRTQAVLIAKELDAAGLPPAEV